MNKMHLILLWSLILVLVLTLGPTQACVGLAFLLITIYLLKANSFMTVMILLELLVMNMIVFLLTSNTMLMFNYWNLFSIMVFSAVEASLGLALLVFLARGWGSSLKLSSFK